MTLTCRSCGAQLEATRVPWYADDHDGADLVAECVPCGKWTVEAE